MIRKLSQETSEIIKSQQYINNTYTITKELLENSLDSSATVIKIFIEEDSIRVDDNGNGIEDLKDVGSQGFTSKETTTYYVLGLNEDSSNLYCGYRGLALCSIKKMCDLEIISKHKNNDLAYKKNMTTGIISPCPRENGTTVNVRNIFYNCPIRQKLNKKNQSKDLKLVLKLVEAYSMVYKIDFLVKYKGSTLLNKSGNENLLEYCKKHHSKIYNECLLRDTKDYFIFMLPSNGKEESKIFYGKRFVTSKKILKEIKNVCNLYEEGTPLFYLELKGLLDFNISPDKSEILFENEDELIGNLKEIIQDYFGKQIYSKRNQKIQMESTLDFFKDKYPSTEETTFRSQSSGGVIKLQKSSKIFPNNFVKREKLNESNNRTEITKNDDIQHSNISSESTIKNENTINNENTQKIIDEFVSEPVQRQHEVSDTFVEELENENLKEEKIQKNDLTANFIPTTPVSSHFQDRFSSPALNKICAKNIISENDFNVEETKVELIGNENKIKLIENETEVELIENEVELIENEVELNENQVELNENEVELNENNVDLNENNVELNENEVELNENNVDLIENEVELNENVIDLVENESKIDLIDVNFTVHCKNEQCFNDNNSLKLEETIFDYINFNPPQEISLTIQKGDFYNMEIIGQFNKGFILTKLIKKDKIYLLIIDQHASDEIYNYENIKNTTKIARQKMVIPLELELSPIDKIFVEEHLSTFSKYGFEIQNNKLLTMPVFKGEEFKLKDFHCLLENIKNGDYEIGKIHKIMASKACRMSIMIGDPLTKSRMEKIVRNLGALEKPWKCPHGRPTFMVIEEMPIN